MLIRLIGVRLSGLISGVQQLDLFEDTSEMIRLYLTIDKLRNRFGMLSVRKASGIEFNEFEEGQEKAGQQSAEYTPEQHRQIDNLKNRRWHYWYR